MKPPLWRLIAGLLVFAGLIAVLLALAPIYVDNFQLQRYERELTHRPDASTTPDEVLRTRVVDRARQLNLPVQPGDVEVTHASGGLQIGTKYIVQVDFRLYQVDLHFR